MKERKDINSDRIKMFNDASDALTVVIKDTMNDMDDVALLILQGVLVDAQYLLSSAAAVEITGDYEGFLKRCKNVIKGEKEDDEKNNS